ncbi:MAG: hypothetical protein JW856_05500, partial [Dehalococcoidales bacterium]|nr:hypothetical protein [Dehalococcoidales bacterium]
PGTIPVDAVYIAPNQPRQMTMMPEIDLDAEMKSGVDVLYVTRPQKERFTIEEKESGLHFPIVDRKLMNSQEFKKALVMHPLPRVDELAYDMDSDPRSMYFKQAARGVPVRMALIAQLLGVKEPPVSKEPVAPEIDYPLYQRGYGVKCSNPRCVTWQKTEGNYLKPEFKIVGFAPLTFRCVYCEHGTEPKYVASTEWHQGMVEYKRYHRANSHLAKKIRPENLIAFDSAEEAEAQGFKPGRYACSKAEKGKTKE